MWCIDTTKQFKKPIDKHNNLDGMKNNEALWKKANLKSLHLYSHTWNDKSR